MNILEKEIEDIVFNTPNELLQSRGLPINGIKFRQVNLGSYGVADVISVNIKKWVDSGWSINIQVIELKKDVIDANTLLQSMRYTKGLHEAILKNFNINNRSVAFEHLIIGKQIQTNGDFVYLLDHTPTVKAFTVSIDLTKGICFERQNGFSLVKPALPTFTIEQRHLLLDHIRLAISNPFDDLPF